jgi:nucleoside 2-deoxyribosyltransferase
MNDKNEAFRAFLAHPVSDYQGSDGVYRPEKQQFLSSVISSLQSLGIVVECAALNEDYGRIKLEPREFTQYDVDAIKRSDMLILVTSERITRDMYLEVGIAYALELPVFMFIPASAYRRHVTYMILGFEEQGSVKLYPYDSEAEVPKLIQHHLGDFIRSTLQ